MQNEAAKRILQKGSSRVLGFRVQGLGYSGFRVSVLRALTSPMRFWTLGFADAQAPLWKYLVVSLSNVYASSCQYEAGMAGADS